MKITLLLLTVSMFIALPVKADGPANFTGRNTEPASQANSCEYSRFVGQKESDIDRAQFGTGAVVRVLKPGQMVTMEYLEGRVNLNVDDDGVVVSVTCG